MTKFYAEHGEWITKDRIRQVKILHKMESEDVELLIAFIHSLPYMGFNSIYFIYNGEKYFITRMAG